MHVLRRSQEIVVAFARISLQSSQPTSYADPVVVVIFVCGSIARASARAVNRVSARLRSPYVSTTLLVASRAFRLIVLLLRLCCSTVVAECSGDNVRIVISSVSLRIVTVRLQRALRKLCMKGKLAQARRAKRITCFFAQLPSAWLQPELKGAKLTLGDTVI